MVDRRRDQNSTKFRRRNDVVCLLGIMFTYLEVHPYLKHHTLET